MMSGLYSAANGRTAVEYVAALDDLSLDGSGLGGTRATGLLMAGTLTFSSSGELQNITAFTPPSSGDPTDLAAWTPSGVVNGSPAFTVTVAGSEAQTIGLDMGLTLAGTAASGLASAADASADPSGIYAANISATRSSTASNAYGETSGSILSSMDGYGEGYLQDFTVASDGTISGKYSNGQTVELYQTAVPVYRRRRA
jgi:flagellar hook protein FlgE